jgi:hypothetical protein
MPSFPNDFAYAKYDLQSATVTSNYGRAVTILSTILIVIMIYSMLCKTIKSFMKILLYETHSALANT